MSDILSQGGDREPRRRWRWVIPLAVLAAVTVLVVQHLPHHRHGPAHPRSASPSQAALPLVPVGLHVREPGGVSGLPMSRDHSLRLPLAGPQPAWLSLGTGHEQLIRGLPRDESGYQFNRRPGRLGGTGRFRRSSPVRQLRRTAGAGLLPGRRRAVGDPARDREPGRPGRLRPYPLADELSARHRHEDHRGHGAGGQPHRRTLRALRSGCRPDMRSTRRPTAACCCPRRLSRGRPSPRCGARPPPRPAGPSTGS